MSTMVQKIMELIFFCKISGVSIWNKPDDFKEPSERRIKIDFFFYSTLYFFMRYYKYYLIKLYYLKLLRDMIIITYFTFNY